MAQKKRVLNSTHYKEKNSPNLPIKPMVSWVIFKQTSSGPKILTSWRIIKDPTYDPNGITDRVWETGGETLNAQKEDELSALKRGIKEELGINISLKCIWPNPIRDKTQKGGIVHAVYPLCEMESLGKPHHWKGHSYAVKVPLNWEPRSEYGDGEVGKIKWWTLEELAKAISKNQDQFMFMHLPGIKRLIQLLGSSSLPAL